MNGERSEVPAVEIPQVLSAALAAGVYICIAQRTGGYLLNPRCPTPWNYILGFSLMAMIGIWNTKNFVDDFKAFARRSDAGFSLGPTVAFSAATFTTLGVSATLLFDGMKPIYGLIVFFVLCSIWSATSWRRRWKKDRSDPEIPKRGLRVFLYAICAAILAIATVVDHWVGIVVAWIAVFGVFVFDARQYKTFSSSMTGVIP